MISELSLGTVLLLALPLLLVGLVVLFSPGDGDYRKRRRELIEKRLERRGDRD